MFNKTLSVCILYVSNFQIFQGDNFTQSKASTLILYVKGKHILLLLLLFIGWKYNACMDMCIPINIDFQQKFFTKSQDSHTKIVRKSGLSSIIYTSCFVSYTWILIIFLYLHEYYLWYIYFRTNFTKKKSSHSIYCKQ